MPPSPPPPGSTLQPPAGDAAFRRGLAFLQGGKPEEALSHLAEAVEQSSDNARYRGVYAQALWDLKKLDEALDQAGIAAHLAPSQYRLVYARFLAHASKPEAAAREYEALLTADPRSFDVLREAGAAYGEAKAFSKAAECLRRATELRQDDVEAQRGLGWALEKAGDPKGAIDAYQKALTLSPGVPETRGRLAELLFDQGRKEEAIRTYQEGIARDPGSALMQRGLGGAFDRLGRTAEAAAAYREYVKLAPNAEDAKAVAARANRLDPQQPAAGS